MHRICIKNENTKIPLPYGKINLIGLLTVNQLFRSKWYRRTINGHWNIIPGNAIFYWNSITSFFSLLFVPLHTNGMVPNARSYF